MEKNQKSGKHFYRQALNLCLAMITQQLILNLITIIDNVMVGRYGDLFVSSVAIVNRLFTVPSSFLNGILAGGGVFLAQYAGIDQPQRMTQTFRFSLAASIALLFPFILAELVFTQPLIRLFSSDPALEGPAAVYLQLLALSMIPYVLSQAIANALRAIGQVRLPLWGSCAAVIVKILANLILLEGIPGGMLGAGLAMLLCRCAEALIMIVLMKHSRCVYAQAWKTTPKMPRSLTLQIGKTMLPIGLNELFYGLGLAMLFKGYSLFSTSMTAGYAIAMTYYELFRVLFPAAGTVMTILVGPVLGQGKKAEAKEVVRHVFKLALGLSVVFGILIDLCRWTIPLIYTGSVLSLRTADQLMRIMALLFPLATGHFLVYFVFRSGGDSRSIFLIDSLFMWIVPIPLLIGLTCETGLPLTVVYFLVEISYVLKCLLALTLLKKERWLNNLTQPEVSPKELFAKKREIENCDHAIKQPNQIEALAEISDVSTSEVSRCGSNYK